MPTKECPPGKVLNPKTNRCIKEKPECPPGKVLNPKTKRCIKEKPIKPGKMSDLPPDIKNTSPKIKVAAKAAHPKDVSISPTKLNKSQSEVTATDYANRSREIRDYAKNVCNNYKFPLYDFTHETLIKDVRAKLLEGINKKLSEDFTNVLKNKDFESGMKRLDELRNELDKLM